MSIRADGDVIEIEFLTVGRDPAPRRDSSGRLLFAVRSQRGHSVLMAGSASDSRFRGGCASAADA
jgi:hypothetical protein